MTGEARRQSICLTMIVRDEADIVGEVLDATAPYIDYWVVVDTGSTDGTQDVIGRHMARLGIPGEVHERPWRDFGHNRSEALTLAQGKADYIWMMDADDTVIGVPPFGGLTADCYNMRIRVGSERFWRRQLFRDGVPWYYQGVLHEYTQCDEPITEANCCCSPGQLTWLCNWGRPTEAGRGGNTAIGVRCTPRVGGRAGAQGAVVVPSGWAREGAAKPGTARAATSRKGRGCW
jgi:hypothetical protein